MAARGATAVHHSAASDGRFNLKDKRVSIQTTVAELARYMLGWRGYFCFCPTPECCGTSPAGSGCRCGPLCDDSGKHHADADWH
jgi:hypothetical protein